MKQLKYESPLKKWLRENHMTHRELALRIGAGENMVARYVAGTNLPTGDRMDRLVKLTGITPEQFEAGRYKPTA